MSFPTFSFSLLSLIRTFWLIAGEPLPQYPFAPWSPTILLWAVQIAQWGSMTEECWEQELRVRNDSCSAFQTFVLLCIRFTVEQICAMWFNDLLYLAFGVRYGSVSFLFQLLQREVLNSQNCMKHSVPSFKLERSPTFLMTFSNFPKTDFLFH